MRSANTQKLAGLGLVAAMAIAMAWALSGPPRTQVVGTLTPDDLARVLRLVQHDLESRLLPKLELDSLRYPRYIVGGIREYRAQRILWVEAHDDGHVEVYAGVSKAVVRDEGHHWQLRRSPTWKITGYSYWASSNGAPENLRLPLAEPSTK